MKPILSLFIIFIVFQFAHAQETINWVSFEEAEYKQAQEQKAVLVFMHTDWCGWCKRMQRETFSNPTIISFINENFYAIDLDAEGADTILFKGQTFVNQNPGQKRQYHDLAKVLAQGRMSFPTVIYLDSQMNGITSVPGFFPPEKFEPVINYYGTGAYRHSNWERYKEEFNGSL